MAMQFSTDTRNAMADQLTSQAGASAYLRIFSGVKPANCGAALSGNTLLGEMVCGATFAPAASNGVLTLNTIGQEASADATGTAIFFRIYKSNGTTCVAQGTCGVAGADLNLNSVSIIAGGTITITSFTLTAPGA